jgi:uncharacterized protein YndB with AHSA1/START domain
VSYIAATPDKVFKALTSTEATSKFWFGNAVTSDWKVGSPTACHREGKLILQGKVLEYDPPRRLSHTFRPMHDEAFSAEQPSRVVYELEQQKDQIKLTVTHDDFAEDSKVFASISNGWPLVLPQTGQVIPNLPVLAPSGPNGRETFQDRAVRCAHQAQSNIHI